MAMIIKEISAAVDEKNNVPVIVAKQKDFKSRFINVRLINSSGFMKIQKNANVIANFKRGDGEAKSFAGGVNEDGTVKILLPFWVLELSDTAVCDISIIEPDGSKLTSMSFNIVVEEAANPENSDISEDDDYEILLSLINEVQALKEHCKEAIDVALDTAEDLKQAAENGEFNGEQGETGKPATVSIGTVTSVSSDSPLTVTNTGTLSDAVLNFQIPKGETDYEELEKIAFKSMVEGAPAVCTTSADWRMRKISVFGKTEQVTTTGKNLIPENGSWGWQPAIFGSSFNAGVWRLLNKMPFGPRNGVLVLTFPEDGEYTLSLQSLSHDVKIYIEKTIQQKSTQIAFISNTERSKSFMVSDYNSAEFSLKVAVPERTDLRITHLQLEKGSTATLYEPYSGGNPSLSPEYHQPLIPMEITKIIAEGTEGQEQECSFSKPVSLHGIQSDKGNVAIDGVKYISDVLDAENITRHVGYIASYNGEEIGGQWKSSTGQLSTGAEVIYSLSEPITESLPDEDIQALKALRTFYPTSTISAVTNNGTYAWIRAGIVNDPVNYINEKLIKILENNQI